MDARSVPAIDWKGVRRRVRLIRAALCLPPSEAEEVVEALDAGDEAKLVAFASKHDQSLDWIIRGGPFQYTHGPVCTLRLDQYAACCEFVSP